MIKKYIRRVGAGNTKEREESRKERERGICGLSRNQYNRGMRKKKKK